MAIDWQCDVKLPARSQCIKRKIICPGYPDPLDLVFRDQSHRFQPAPTTSRKTLSAPIISLHPSTPSISSHEAAPGKHQSAIVLHSPTHSPRFDISASFLLSAREEAGRSIFWDNVCPVELDPEAHRGFLHQLPPLYSRTCPGSTLYLAVDCLSWVMTSAANGVNITRGLRKYQNAIVVCQKALNDPVECRKDETVMAVLIFSLIQVR